MNSVRFFPHWNPGDAYQVIGLLQMTNEIFRRNPRASRWVEIGSLYGESATLFLGFPQVKKLYCVERSRPHVAALGGKFAKEIASGRCELIPAFSTSFAAVLEHESVDVVYVDGNHEYESVSKDLECFWPKITAGGFLCGHDLHDGFPGVARAVSELCDSRGVSVLETFPDSSWLVCKEA